MIVSKQEMQRLLDTEREYRKSLIKIEEMAKKIAETNKFSEVIQKETLRLNSQVTFYKNEITKYNEITVEVEEYVRERENEIARLNNIVKDYEARLEDINNDNIYLTDIIEKYKLEVQDLELKLKIKEDDSEGN